MIRIFLVLSAINGVLLASAFVTGLIAPGSPGSDSGWRRRHEPIGLGATASGVLVHAAAIGILWGTGRRIRAIEAGRPGVPAGRFGARADRNLRRALPMGLWGLVLVVVASASGLLADAMAVWHLGLVSVALGFNLVAFGIEWISIFGQRRLLIDLSADLARPRPIAPEPVEVAG